jgi:hypothetical protein
MTNVHTRRAVRLLAVLALSLVAVSAWAAAGAFPPEAAAAGAFPPEPAPDGTAVVLAELGDTAIPPSVDSALVSGCTSLGGAPYAEPHAPDVLSPAGGGDEEGTGLGWGLGLFAVGGMVALAKDRNTPRRTAHTESHPVAAGAKIFAGSIVVLNAGYAAPGSIALGLIAVGRANEHVNNSAGAAGDLAVEVERGVFLFANDGTITQADVGKTAYIVDDQTVSDSDRAPAATVAERSPAGKIRGVETGGVWVEILAS